MYASDLPMMTIGGGARLRSAMAQSIKSLQINAGLYGGRHPLAPEIITFLNAAITAATALLPVAGTMTFNPTAKSYSIAGGVAQAGPILNRGTGNDGAVTYTSGTPANATVNATTGAVTPKAAGTSVIMASVAAYGGFLASTKTYVATITA